MAFWHSLLVLHSSYEYLQNIFLNGIFFLWLLARFSSIAALTRLKKKPLHHLYNIHKKFKWMNEIVYDPKMSADWLLKFVVFVLLYVCCVVVVVSSYSEQHGLSCTVLGLVNRYESTKFDRPCSTGSLHWNFWHAIKHFFFTHTKIHAHTYTRAYGTRHSTCRRTM